MAEPARDTQVHPLALPPPSTQPVLQSRRASFRRSLTDGSLPPEYLEQLELKRKQLDESIHKYIASKEREYKNLERALEQRVRNASAGEGRARSGAHESSSRPEHVVARGAGKRRTSSESTTMSTFDELNNGSGPLEQSLLSAQRQSVINALMGSGLRRDSQSMLDEGEEEGTVAERRAALAGLKDRRASLERDKDLVGLFTPPYLPALESEQKSADVRAHLERTASAPAVVALAASDQAQTPSEARDGPTRALSESAITSSTQAKAKRPVQLALASRTSSSGSSADGRLTSAMKSPTHKERPVRKRVSLAVGDCIVAPSDSVPLSLSSNNHAPSHSRPRSSIVLQNDGEGVLEMQVSEDGKPTQTTVIHTEGKATSATVTAKGAHENSTTSRTATTAPISINLTPQSQTSTAAIDPDGDLFDLEEDADGSLVRYDDPEPDDDDQSLNDSDEPSTNEPPSPTQPSVRPLASNEHYDYDTEAGLIPSYDAEVPLSFRPGSIGASQQPTLPGFRRPSISHDPTFVGGDYAAAARKATEDEVYGSSYSRHSTKGSFTAGSLGESFMERNAAEVRMRAANALARREAEVRS